MELVLELLRPYLLPLTSCSFILLTGGLVGIVMSRRKAGAVFFSVLGILTAGMATATMLAMGPDTDQLRQAVWEIRAEPAPKGCFDISCDYI